MAPIRVAIVGLSSTAKTSWASSAHLPYLLSARGREKYTIVALLNSSVEAAQKAIKEYELSPDTKAYGNPQTLADDNDVDLVVVNTRVDVHHDTALPSVKAGKHVYVEWPLAQDAEHVENLVQAARQGGGRTTIGLQGRVAPPILKLRQLLEEGRIGKVLSSEVHATGGLNDRDTWPDFLKYFAKRSIGGNVFTIGLGHLFDQVQHVLGDFVNINSHVQIQRPQIKLRDVASGQITETVDTDVPDLTFLTAGITPSATVQNGASALVRFRNGQPFPNEPALTWTINGTSGELRLTAQAGTTLHAASYSGPVTIEHHDFKTDKVEEVPWSWEDWQEELPMVSRSVAKVYERIYAEHSGDANVVYPTFENASVRHKQLNGILATLDGKPWRDQAALASGPWRFVDGYEK